MISAAHRNYLISELMKGIEAIGLQFESYGYLIADQIYGQRMVHRGTNPIGHPVGHTLDSVSPDGGTAAEYSTVAGYFDDPYTKALGDIRHSITKGPNVRHLLLISSRAYGPKAHSDLKVHVANFQKNNNLFVDIYDSRRQAEIIVDTVLLNDTATEELAQYLPTLDRVRSEYAATHTLPDQSRAYIAQNDMEAAIKAQLQANRCCVVAGMSGSGKSEVTGAVARSMQSSYEMVIWAPASNITSLDNLRAIELERRGHRINLEHLLHQRSCLVVLDDFRLGTTNDEFRNLCGSRSAILATRQHSVPGDLEIQMLGRSDAKRLLNSDLAAPCPDQIFEEVWKAVGGHPLTLRLMNAGVRKGSWDELAEDCKAIGQYNYPERAQKLVDCLLGRQFVQMGRELALFAWAGTSRVDRTFARQAIRPVGIRNLDENCLLAADRGDVLRLHDIVYAALDPERLPVGKHTAHFNDALDKYVASLAFAPGLDLQFLTFCQLHKPLLVRELDRTPARSECLFCLSQSSRDDGSAIGWIGNPVHRTHELLKAAEIRDIDVSAICESLEAVYRWVKVDKDIAAARNELQSQMEAFDLLIGSGRLTDFSLRTVQHHKAKALRNLRKFDEAVALCEQILQAGDNAATSLLLARLIAPRGLEAATRAKDMLFKILEATDQASSLVPLSVSLAAIEALARQELKEWQREAIDKFGKTVARLIVDSAARGFDHAFIAFAAIGRDLKYNNPDLFVEIFQEMPRLSPSLVVDDKEMAAWGCILASAMDVPALNQVATVGNDADLFFQAVKRPAEFIVQQHGMVLFKLGRYQEAADKLRPLVTPTSKPWSRYWLSKVELALGDQPTALRLINEALDHPDSERYKAAFYEQRAEVRKSDPEAELEDLTAAHNACDNAIHRASLEKKIDDCLSRL